MAMVTGGRDGQLGMCGRLRSRHRNLTLQDVRSAPGACREPVRVADRYFSDAQLASLYDLFSPRDRRSDYDFYLPLAMEAGSVLDVGCGTGAFLHELRDAGHTGRLCGLDPAPGMLDLARRRDDIQWVLGDLSTPRWRRAFDFIVMTGHAFQALVTDDEIRTTLAGVREALTEDGVFAFETRNPAQRAWEEWDDRYRGKVVDGEGATVRMNTHLESPFDGAISFRHVFSSDAWPEPQVSRSTLRFLDADALDGFLGEAGLVADARFGDWDRSPLTLQSPEIIMLARRA